MAGEGSFTTDAPLIRIPFRVCITIAKQPNHMLPPLTLFFLSTTMYVAGHGEDGIVSKSGGGPRPVFNGLFLLRE